MTPSAGLRAEFPLLVANPGLHYLDSAATAQIHRSALDAVIRYESGSRANVLRGSHRLAEAADRAYDAARASVARFLNAPSADEIVFTSGATAALNLVAHAFGATLRPGDRVLVSQAEHHSNFVPWQMLRERAGIVLDLLPVMASGELDLAALPRLLTPRTRLVAVTQCSNVTGAWTDVAAVVAAARAVGAHVLLDGAQAVQHVSSAAAA
ncbi:MAG: aminotransferase class V-fold PLP-dependent enzyme [Sulfuritalea sp.]|nr:aminotransferase class V-fold PLP-dependent enzyme [Sulfuritalea sp.]